MSCDPKEGKDRPKAVALLSGGLDSSLAVRMMLDQGVEVEAVAIKTPFCDFDCGKGCGHRVKEVADELGIKLKTVYLGDEYLRMLRNPRHGYGSGMNPCIDCREMMYNAAKDHMAKIGADFVVTGEVLFQRPMSQNHRALDMIENETGLTGKVLRPLSAKCLAPTEAEKAGIITRDKLGDIKGRSRKGQLALAQHYGISDPPNAAGGCLLTDPAFSKRVSDLLDHSDGIPSINDIELLKVGRHFRLNPRAKLVVGRNQGENDIISALMMDGDILIEAKEYVGPTCIVRARNYEDADVVKSAAIALRYSDCPDDAESRVRVVSCGTESELSVRPARDHDLEDLRI